MIWYVSSVSKVLLSTGYPKNLATKTEVIDLEDSNVICDDLENFPMEIVEGVGAILASIPIICGGTFWNQGSPYSPHSFDKCFKLGSSVHASLAC